MYRLLVVDDEERITDSLAVMLEGVRDLGLDVYKAYSAQEALELMHRTSFDILLSDIQMPGMNGIELLVQVRRQWPTCRVIFLSGHDEFQYAHQAIQHQAVSYILKSQGDEALLAAIRECIAQIELEANDRALVLRAAQQIAWYQPILRREFLNTLLTGSSYGPHELASQLQRFHAELDAGQPLLLLAARVDHYPLEDLSTALDMVVRERIGHGARSEMASGDSGFLLWLVQPRPGEAIQRAAVTVNGMAESIQRTCLNSLRLSLSFIFDDCPCAWPELQARAEAVRRAVESLPRLHGDMAFVEMAFFRDIAQGQAIRDASQPDAAAREGFVGGVDRYIKTHLAADLSLVALSEQVHLNPSYLSRRYKELTGRNISDAVAEARMARAAQLLTQESTRIRLIAEQVGFTSAAHFSRVFKKHTGMTPQEYRDSPGAR